MQKRIQILALSILSATAAACSSPPPPPPAASNAPPPVAVPAPAANTAIVQPQGSWMDWPISAGDWVYRRDARGSIALFGAPGTDALITLRCDVARGRIYLARADESGAGAGKLTLRSSSALKQFNVLPTGGTPPYVAAEILPDDGILDAMAYTRGRIAIEAQGQKSIAVPLWAEASRIVEDCRA